MRTAISSQHIEIHGNDWDCGCVARCSVRVQTCLKLPAFLTLAYFIFVWLRVKGPICPGGVCLATQRRMPAAILCPTLVVCGLCPNRRKRDLYCKTTTLATTFDSESRRSCQKCFTLYVHTMRRWHECFVDWIFELIKIRKRITHSTEVQYL